MICAAVIISNPTTVSAGNEQTAVEDTGEQQPSLRQEIQKLKKETGLTRPRNRSWRTWISFIRKGGYVMRRIIGMFVCISLLLNLSFTSYASERLIPSEGNEYQEILSMKDEVLYHINYGGARGELNRDVEADEVEMERAYKVYANSELLKTNDFKESLENSYYKWQIPVYTDGFTILVDITKVTSIPDDIPEDAKETLKQKLNIWTVGAVYVYDAETVDYDNTVTTSLEEAGYNSDEYSYEVVSGLPGIRYPAAIIFNADEKPEFVIPAQKSTTHVFNGEWPTAAKIGRKRYLQMHRIVIMIT